MNKLLSFMLGLGAGALVGAVLVMLFAPMAGDDLVARLKQGWQDTLAEARKASEQRRAELEAELAAKRGQTPPRLPPGTTKR
jgi:gas vesicle protein